MIGLIWKCIKTTFFTVGVPVIYAGSTLFGVQELLRYLNIADSALTIICEIVAITSTAYTFTVTQGITNWKLFTDYSQENKSADTGFIEYIKSEYATLMPLSKALSLGVLLVGIPVAFTTFGLWGYYASDILCRYFGLQNNIALIAINSYIAVTASTSAIYFALRTGKKNLFWIIKKINGTLDHEPLIWGKAIPALFIGSDRMIGQMATVNLCVKGALSILPEVRQLPTGVKEAIAAAFTVTGVGICSQNRTIQLYNRFIARDGGVQEDNDFELSGVQKAIKVTHDINGWLYIASFALLTYVSYMDAEEQMGINAKQWFMIVLNIINSICGAAVEEAFTRRAMWRETLTIIDVAKTISIPTSLNYDSSNRFFPTRKKDYEVVQCDVTSKYPLLQANEGAETSRVELLSNCSIK